MARYRDDAPRPRFDDLGATEEEYNGIPAPRLRRRARKSEAGGGELTLGVLRDLPHFARLLYGVARDPRVSKLDKGLALAAVVYVVSPIDILPDSIPVIGQIDDIYLVALALGRLLNNAGIEVLLDHWEGDEESLETALSLLERAGSLLPEPLRMLMGRSRG
jgi:uncharacterized membrane protein YkvA (DUF1232 family)